MLTRVLVLRLLKVIATVLPVNAPDNDAGIDPDLIALLWPSALRTRLVSSAELRSYDSIRSVFRQCCARVVTAMESRWRGANGEVGGEAGDEYALFCSFSSELRRYWGRIASILEICPLVPQSLTGAEGS